ncbi:MFS general substrate transporter [Laetiporus sulphureus 93-53]|uniref:MFS general substrate transporter n=1 Tax=Laetiporus sulphureus 93-53 TaxID=1314785 RepID=A0A165HVJ8_9APHY|nr:MFS general substrate transporter [Laetiporus sulphureus 93-53]KZT12246.1 MFS general substrate transporter [Laetiporus sulphureus 93-53]
MADAEKPRQSLATSYTHETVDDSYAPSSPRTLVPHDDRAEDEFPDGGIQAWLTVLGAFLSLYCSFGQLNAFGTFQSWYAEHQLQAYPAFTISWIGSLQLWVFFFSGGFIGRITDERGPRFLMIPGTLVLIFSMMITSICTSYYEYVLCQGILTGLGIGMVFYPSLSAIATHFKRYRATAIGIAMTGSGIGGVIYPIMYRRLFSLVGFGWAVRISAFICLALSTVALVTVRSRLPPGPRKRAWFDIESFRDVRFTIVAVGSIFISFGLFMPNFYIVDYSISHSVPTTTAFYVLAILNAGSVPGRLLPSLLSDTVGRFNIIVPCVFLSGLLTLALWTSCKDLASIVVYAALFGFFSGGFNALIISCVAQISEIQSVGTRVGMLYTIISFPSLGGGPAAGALVKHAHGSYTGLIVLSGATVLTGSLFMLLARLKIDRRLSARV